MREWRSRFSVRQAPDRNADAERWRRHGAWTATGPNARKAMGDCGAGSARHVGRAPIVATAALLHGRRQKGGFGEWGGRSHRHRRDIISALWYRLRNAASEKRREPVMRKKLIAALAVLAFLGAAGAATYIATTPAVAEPQCSGC